MIHFLRCFILHSTSAFSSKVVGIWSCTVVEEIWITCPDGYETDCEAGCVPLRTQCREEEVPERFPVVNQQIFWGRHQKTSKEHLTWRGDLSSRDITIHPSSCVQKTFEWLPDQWWHFAISMSSFSEVCLPSHHKKVLWWDHQSRRKFVSQVDDFPQQIPCGRAPLTRSSKYTLSLTFGLHLCCWSTFLTIEVGHRQVALSSLIHGLHLSTPPVPWDSQNSQFSDISSTPNPVTGGDRWISSLGFDVTVALSTRGCRSAMDL